MAIERKRRASYARALKVAAIVIEIDLDAAMGTQKGRDLKTILRETSNDQPIRQIGMQYLHGATWLVAEARASAGRRIVPRSPPAHPYGTD